MRDITSKWFNITLFFVILISNSFPGYSQEKQLLKVKGGYRYLNENGEWTGPLIPSNLGIREHLENGWFITYGEDYYYNSGLIDQNGRVILPPEYSYDIDIETGLLNGLNFIICSKSIDHYIKKGLVDTNGVQLLPFEYMGELEYYKGYWAYRKWSGESGVMDAKFRIIIEERGLDFQLYPDLIIGHAWDSSYIYDYTGKKIYEEHFKKITPYFGGRCFVFKQNNLYGIMNRKGKIIREADLEMEPVFKAEGTALTRERNKGWNLVDTAGKLLIQPGKNGYLSLPNGYINYANSNIAFLSWGYWGITDRFGNNLVPYMYKDFALDSNAFQHDLYIFSTDTGWGMVNAAAKVILQPVYDSVWVDRDGRVFVMQNGKYGLFDKKGENILPVENDMIEKFEYGYAQFQKNKKWGLLNKHGKVFLAPEYESIIDHCKYAIEVSLNGKYALVDSAGKVLTPLSDERLNLRTYDCWAGHIIYGEETFDLWNGREQTKLMVMDSLGNRISAKSFNNIEDIGGYFMVNNTADYGDGYSIEYEGGLMDYQGKLILVPRKKTYITRVFPNGSFVVTTRDGHFYYSPNGEKKKLE